MKQNIQIKIAAVVLILTTLACGAGPATPNAAEVSTVVAGTLQALTPLASPTIAPTNTIPATSPAVPTGTTAPSANLPSATRISFAAGTTQSVSSGSTLPGTTMYYVLRASKDQPMIVSVDSPDQSATLSIFGANGAQLVTPSQSYTSWQGLLPATQDYYFGISGNGSDFLLNVIIPARVKFASGQNQVTLTGQTTGGYGVTYVLYALSGQKMDVTINTDPNVAALTIWGLTDGQPYARAQNGVVDFSMTLPSTQDYIVQVVPQGGQVVNYSVKIKVQ